MRLTARNRSRLEDQRDVSRANKSRRQLFRRLDLSLLVRRVLEQEPARLARPELSVEAASPDEFLVRPVLDDAALVPDDQPCLFYTSRCV